MVVKISQDKFLPAQNARQVLLASVLFVPETWEFRIPTYAWPACDERRLQGTTANGWKSSLDISHCHKSRLQSRVCCFYFVDVFYYFLFSFLLGCLLTSAGKKRICIKNVITVTQNMRILSHLSALRASGGWWWARPWHFWLRCDDVEERARRCSVRWCPSVRLWQPQMVVFRLYIRSSFLQSCTTLKLFSVWLCKE